MPSLEGLAALEQCLELRVGQQELSRRMREVEEEVEELDNRDAVFMDNEGNLGELEIALPINSTQPLSPLSSLSR